MHSAEPGEVQDFGATYAVCSEVLEHVDEPLVVLKNASPYLAPGCRVVVTVPGGPMSAFYKHIGHRRHYSRRELGRLLDQAGIHVDRLYAAGFPFFNLFRLFVTLRGDKLIEDVTGPPSRFMRFGMLVTDLLFRFNLMYWGWQIIGVGRYLGDGGPQRMVAAATEPFPAGRP